LPTGLPTSSPTPPPKVFLEFVADLLPVSVADLFTDAVSDADAHEYFTDAVSDAAAHRSANIITDVVTRHTPRLPPT
jgi:hypothetical protein